MADRPDPRSFGAHPRRIAIIGSGGAGKSTLARQLGEILGLPVIHLDLHHWRPGWEPTPAEEWVEVQRRLVSGDRWIIDGNYNSTLHIRLEAADTVVFLDLPRVICLWRVLKRTFHAWLGRRRADMAPGCEERLDLSFLRWVWTFPKHSRLRIVSLVTDPGFGGRVVWLRSGREVAAFLRQLREGASRWPSRTPELRNEER